MGKTRANNPMHMHADRSFFLKKMNETLSTLHRSRSGAECISKENFKSSFFRSAVGSSTLQVLVYNVKYHVKDRYEYCKFICLANDSTLIIPCKQ